MVEQRGIEPLTSALRMEKQAHCSFWHSVTCSDITYDSSMGCSHHRSKFLCSFCHRFSSICIKSSDESVTFFESISQQIFLASAEQVRRFAFLALTRFFVTSLFCQTQTPGTSISFLCRKNRYDKHRRHYFLDAEKCHLTSRLIVPCMYECPSKRIVA